MEAPEADGEGQVYYRRFPGVGPMKCPTLRLYSSMIDE